MWYKMSKAEFWNPRNPKGTVVNALGVPVYRDLVTMREVGVDTLYIRIAQTTRMKKVLLPGTFPVLAPESWHWKMWEKFLDFKYVEFRYY